MFTRCIRIYIWLEKKLYLNNHLFFSKRNFLFLFSGCTSGRMSSRREIFWMENSRRKDRTRLEQDDVGGSRSHQIAQLELQSPVVLQRGEILYLLGIP